jgi:hypothetical protein
LLRSRLGDRNDLGLIGSRSLSELLGELASFFFGQRAGLGFVKKSERSDLRCMFPFIDVVCDSAMGPANAQATAPNRHDSVTAGPAFAAAAC